MSERSPFDAVRQHYTQVCRCEWSADDFDRLTTSANCSIHGKAPDPLAELEEMYDSRRSRYNAGLSHREVLEGMSEGTIPRV